MRTPRALLPDREWEYAAPPKSRTPPNSNQTCRRRDRVHGRPCKVSSALAAWWFDLWQSGGSESCARCCSPVVCSLPHIEAWQFQTSSSAAEVFCGIDHRACVVTRQRGKSLLPHCNRRITVEQRTCRISTARGSVPTLCPTAKSLSISVFGGASPDRMYIRDRHPLAMLYILVGQPSSVMHTVPSTSQVFLAHKLSVEPWCRSQSLELHAQPGCWTCSAAAH